MEIHHFVCQAFHLPFPKNIRFECLHAWKIDVILMWSFRCTCNVDDRLVDLVKYRSWTGHCQSMRNSLCIIIILTLGWWCNNLHPARASPTVSRLVVHLSIRCSVYWRVNKHSSPLELGFLALEHWSTYVLLTKQGEFLASLCPLLFLWQTCRIHLTCQH